MVEAVVANRGGADRRARAGESPVGEGTRCHGSESPPPPRCARSARPGRGGVDHRSVGGTHPVGLGVSRCRRLEGPWSDRGARRAPVVGRWAGTIKVRLGSARDLPTPQRKAHAIIRRVPPTIGLGSEDPIRRRRRTSSSGHGWPRRYSFQPLSAAARSSGLNGSSSSGSASKNGSSRRSPTVSFLSGLATSAPVPASSTMRRIVGRQVQRGTDRATASYACVARR